MSIFNTPHMESLAGFQDRTSCPVASFPNQISYSIGGKTKMNKTTESRLVVIYWVLLVILVVAVPFVIS